MTLGPSPDVIRQRIADQCHKHRISFASLSRVLGRQDGYIARFVREKVPYQLAPAERARAAEFFGVPGPHLGAPARPSYRQEFSQRMRSRSRYRTVLRREV